MNPFNDKRNRDRASLGAAHDIVCDDEVPQTATPNFDGGARPAASGAMPAPTLGHRRARRLDGTEVDDGAALLFPWIEDER